MAETRKRAKVNQVVGESSDLVDHDRLSELPDNLIEYILECMPICDAVRTCILGRKWRKTWTRVRVLRFDEKFVRKEIEEPRVRSVAVMTRKTPRVKRNDFIEAIGSVMLLHNGPIHKFIFHVPKFCWGPGVDCNRKVLGALPKWMHVVSCSGVKEMIINAPLPGLPLSSYLFDCQELRHLALYNCIINLPRDFKGFGNLISLYVDSLLLPDDELNTLISSCPLLEDLTILCKGGNLHVSALRLKTLNVTFYSLKSLSLHNVPNLVTLSVKDFSSDINDGNLYDIVPILGSLSKIANITLSGELLRVMGHVPKMLPNPLECHVNLTLLKINVAHQNQLLSALCIIRSSPNLRTLSVSISTSLSIYDLDSPEILLNEPNFYLYSLLTVKVKELLGTPAQIMFLQFILTSSPALETLYANARASIPGEVELIMMSDLLETPRASSKAKIKFSKGRGSSARSYSEGPVDSSMFKFS